MFFLHKSISPFSHASGIPVQADSGAEYKTKSAYPTEWVDALWIHDCVVGAIAPVCIVAQGGVNDGQH